MIAPDIWDDPEVGGLTGPEFRLFIGCISLADDEGRLDADPRGLRKTIFGFDEDATVDQVRDWRDSIVQKLPNLCMYQVGAKTYIALTQWHKHQSIGSWKKPSQIPAPSSVDQQETYSRPTEEPTRVSEPMNESIESINESNSTPPEGGDPLFPEGPAPPPPPKRTKEQRREATAAAYFGSAQRTEGVDSAFRSLPLFQGQILTEFYSVSGMPIPKTKKRVEQAAAAAEILYQELGSAEKVCTLLRQFFTMRADGHEFYQFTVNGPWSVKETVINMIATNKPPPVVTIDVEANPEWL